MPGVLPRVAVLPPEGVESGMVKLDVTGEAIEGVKRVVPTPPAPFVAHQPNPQLDGFILPPSLVTLDDDALGELLVKAGEWASYVEYYLAQFDADRRSAEAQLEFIQASIRLSLRADEILGDRPKKLTVSEKTDMMRTDPRVVDGQAKAIKTEAMYQMVKAINAKAQRNWDTVSRRITQRGQQLERIRREQNIGSIPAQAARTFRQY